MKKQIFKPLNSVIQICNRCGKIDVAEGHEKECDPEYEEARRENEEHYN